MTFFRNFPHVFYNFGDEVNPTIFQNISVYIDLLDQIVDDVSFYQKYTIQNGERPDTLSYKLYDTVDYYWTFFLLNENIRKQGWPLTFQELEEKSKVYYPHTVITTDDSLHEEFYVGDIVATNDTFSNPRFKGKIIEKRFDQGQLVIQPIREVRSITITNPGSGYTSAPTVTIVGDGTGATAQALLDSDTVSNIELLTLGDNYTYAPTVTISAPQNDRGDRATATASLSTNVVYRRTILHSQIGEPDTRNWDLTNPNLRETTVLDVEFQYDSIHHFEDSNGEYVDVPLSSTTGKGIDYNAVTSGAFGETPVTFKDRLIRQNDELAEIRVLKPSVCAQVVQEFNRLLRQ